MLAAELYDLHMKLLVRFLGVPVLFCTLGVEKKNIFLFESGKLVFFLTWKTVIVV